MISTFQIAPSRTGGIATKGKIAAGLLLAFLLAVLTAGCQEIDPRTIYTQAQKKTTALTSGQQTLALTFTIDPEGENKVYTWEMDVAFVQNEENPGLDVRSMTTFPEKTFTSDSAYIDGRFYVDDNGTRYQSEMEYTVMQQRIGRVYPDLTLSVSQLKELTCEDTEEGKTFAFTVAGKHVTVLTDFVMNQILNFDTFVPTDATTKTASGTAVVDDNNYISRLGLEIPCIVVQNQKEYEAVLEYTKELKVPEKEVSIQVENPESYKQVTIWDLPW